nr:GNAT family protein [Clostridium sp. 'deep sea']
MVLRNITINDLENYFYLKHPSREYHKFNGPYFKQTTEEELKACIKKLRTKLLNKDEGFHEVRQMIANKDTNELIGEVSWYWKSKETLWMEVGIVIFNEKYWGKGIGYQALPLWIDILFEKYPQLVRLGLTTWSGNLRMIKLAEKTGLKCEAVYRKARIVDGKYYDSVSYGILREERNS